MTAILDIADALSLHVLKARALEAAVQQLVEEHNDEKLARGVAYLAQLVADDVEQISRQHQALIQQQREAA